MMSSDQKNVLKKIVSTLQENTIDFQITGGLAAIFYGAKRPLYDIDIDVYEKDIQKIRTIFKNDITTDYHHLQNTEFDLYLLTVTRDGVLIDISQQENAYIYDAHGKRVKMQSDISHAEKILWNGMSLPVQNKQELMQYKKLLNRDTDVTDIQAII